jgi:hypothetical protein
VPNLEPIEVDERLAAVERNVKAGKFAESPWLLFKQGYFRNVTEEQAMKAMKSWGIRNGIEVSWRVGKSEIAGQLFDVTWLMLK